MAREPGVKKGWWHIGFRGKEGNANAMLRCLSKLLPIVIIIIYFFSSMSMVGWAYPPYTLVYGWIPRQRAFR